MNSPPPVRFPLGRSLPRGVIVLVTLVWLLAWVLPLIVLTRDALTQQRVWALLIVLAALLLGAVLAWRLRRGQVWDVLTWSGEQWFLEQAQNQGNAAAIAPPDIRLDGQHWLLLHARLGRRAVWLWPARATDPAQWHALRCALYAQPAQDSVPA